MFLFFHADQEDKNKSYYKGILFEKLMELYFQEAGYEVNLRRKKNSLEYDLEGSNKITSQKIIGEAKAHERPIAGEVVTGFVGKLLPEGLVDKKVYGLLLSTSSLTPEADDYYNRISGFYDVKCITGKQLFGEIFEKLSLPKVETLEEQLSDFGFSNSVTYILTTNHGVYVLLFCKSHDSVEPTHFILFDKKGHRVDDCEFMNSLVENVEELVNLAPLISTQKTEFKLTNQHKIKRGISVGTDWLDYRLPAAPVYFVGRNEFIQKNVEYVLSRSKPNILQIKSRSGVGKSSVLAYLESVLSTKDTIIEVHDSRDVRSTYDFLSVIQRFTSLENTPLDFDEAIKAIKSLTEANPQKACAILVDQFESTFFRPDIFYLYESLAISTASYNNFYLIIARKNDQITTFDETNISLQRLNEISKSFVLSDFEKPEAAKLLEKIIENSYRDIGKDILYYVLEFAQGFPWLLKRTMAHLVKLLQSGISKGELLAGGLKLDDLFDEELEGLDELKKDYLTRIAARLPADYNQLQRGFDEDPLLPRILDKLTQNRLLRLRGYLKTRKRVSKASC